MKNVDRIRKMSIKEMAEVLLDHRCSACDFDGACGQKTKCRKEITDWLKLDVSEVS